MADTTQDFASHHATVGERLRQAREAKGLSLDDVAVQTRIPLRHLKSIEESRWEALPAVTYSVGFARAYANAVGLDGSAISRELRDQLGGTRTAATAPEFYEPADPARVPPRSLAVIAALLAIALLVGYMLWRSSIGEEEAPVAQAPAEQAQPTAPPPAQPQQPAAPANGPVALVATEEVWLRINEGAGGPALFQGVLAAGQRFEVPATAQAPVVRTGRPQVLRVLVGGQDIGQLEPAERTVSNVSLRAADITGIIQARGGAAAPGAAAPAPAGPAPAPAPPAR